MELLAYIVMFASREPFRLAAMRQHGDGDGNGSAAGGGTHILAWLAVCSGVCASLLSLCYYAAYGWGAMDGARACILLVLAGCLLEIAAEPAFIAAQTRLQFGVRFRVESAANLVRCGVTFVAVVLMRSGVVGFGAAQLCYGLVLFLGYWASLTRQHEAPATATPRWQQLLPHRDAATQALVTPAQWQLVRAFAMQTLFKFLMTQADVLVLSGSAGLHELGVYAVVTNYGARRLSSSQL
jgi:hypothetical protein